MRWIAAHPIKWAFALAILIVALALPLFVNSAERTIKYTVDKIAEAFDIRPRVMVDNITVIEPGHEVREWIVFKNDSIQNLEWKHTWWGSEKIIKPRGTFTASYGFDLKASAFIVNFNSKNQTVDVSFPPAKLLAFEMTDIKTEYEQNGWWNHMSKEERDQVINELRNQAKHIAENNKLAIKEAERVMENQIHAVIQSAGTKPGVINFSSPTPLPATP